MIVDDENFNIEAMKGLLTVLKVENMDLIDFAYDGEQSCRLMEKAIQEGDFDRYSLILTDCSMPFLDGYEATKRMREMRIRARQEAS